MILGLDYGKKRIGVALAESTLSEPFGVIEANNHTSIVSKLSKIIDKHKVDKLVIGVSSGKMGKECRDFSKKLKKDILVPIVFQDETLSTREAQNLSIQSGIKRSKRKRMVDAYAASIILQNYLDGNRG